MAKKQQAHAGRKVRSQLPLALPPCMFAERPLLTDWSGLQVLINMIPPSLFPSGTLPPRLLPFGEPSVCPHASVWTRGGGRQGGSWLFREEERQKGAAFCVGGT